MAVGKNIITYMNNLDNTQANVKKEQNQKIKKTNNKGEWSELLAFVRIIVERRITLSDEKLNPTDDFFTVTKVTGKNIDLNFLLTNDNQLEIANKVTGEINFVQINEIINKNTVENLVAQIKAGKGTFRISDFEVI